jgi:two-component system, OmpR family, sensor histidine kinase CiaH
LATKLVNSMDTFQKARVTLTLWYIVICFCMLAVFSFGAIQAERRAFSRIEAVFGDPIERPFLSQILTERLDNFHKDFLQRLLFFDIVLLGCSAGASWFLSGKTLKPIQKMISDQETFAAEASHELRTPIATIEAEIESFKRTQKHISGAYMEVLDSINQETKRMMHLIENLLIAVRPQEQYEFKKINISNVCKTAYAKIQKNTTKKHINFTNTIEKNIYILGEEESIEQLVLILCENAIRYSLDNSSVNIQLLKKNNAAVLIVSDTGIGIESADIPYIFDRFYRGKATRFIKGTGLGLYIAQRIVTEHSGRISVESTLSRGSTFTIQFPEYS